MSGRRVIFSNYGLAGRHGTECFLWDVTRRLQQRGTECGIFSPRLGPFAEEFRAAGIAVWDNPRAIDWEPDVLHCHHIAEAVRLLHRFPNTPGLFMVHEPRLWQGLAPVTPQIRRYVAVDQLCRERLARDCNIKEETIRIIPNGVDLEKFSPRIFLPGRPERALIFTSGAAHNQHLELVKKVCINLGIQVDVAGYGEDKMIAHPEDVLPQYDLVFAKARCALEALSVGCAVVLIGAEGVGEMVSSSRFDHLRAMNFGMGLLDLPLTEEALLRQIQCYDPGDAALVTRRVREECGVELTVAALETLYAEVASFSDVEIPGYPMISLKAAAHLSAEITNDAVQLTQTLQLKNQAIHDLQRALEEQHKRTEDLVKAGHEQRQALEQEQRRAERFILASHEEHLALELERNRAEHYRSKVRELRGRLTKKQKSTTVSSSRTKPSRTLPGLKSIKDTWHRLWHASPVTHGKQSPMPFIVGSPRSGTTLLRLMMDAHPQLAIPAETGFIVPLVGDQRENYGNSENFRKLLTGHPNSESSTWPDFHLKKQVLRDALENLIPFDPAEGLRLFYRLYAARFKKSRYGDKTPLYARHMTGIEALLPEARFIHIVRDGRDAAVSLRKLWFSPGNSMAEQAVYWHDNVLLAREQGRQVQHYLEVSYEKLVQDPKQVLHEICDFIELPYSSEMLSYHARANDRISEHEGRMDREGAVILSKEARLKQQASSSKAPMPELIGRWRTELTSAEVTEFENVAGETLRMFGYETNTGS